MDDPKRNSTDNKRLRAKIDELTKERDLYKHNFEQAICMAQALDDDIRIQIIIGRAGTGKTHIAMAAALLLTTKASAAPVSEVSSTCA